MKHLNNLRKRTCVVLTRESFEELIRQLYKAFFVHLDFNYFDDFDVYIDYKDAPISKRTLIHKLKNYMEVKSIVRIWCDEEKDEIWISYIDY